jgi:hypothetical protein
LLLALESTAQTPAGPGEKYPLRCIVAHRYLTLARDTEDVVVEYSSVLPLHIPHDIDGYPLLVSALCRRTYCA